MMNGSLVMKKKKVTRKKDINKPQKPVSAYAHFFREKQTEIKTKNPDASFGEVSKIVAAEWDSLSSETKVIYKRRADQEKQDYLRALATLKANSIAGNSKMESAKNELPEVKEPVNICPSVAESNFLNTISTGSALSYNEIFPNNTTSTTTTIPSQPLNTNDQWQSELDANIIWTPLPGEFLNQQQHNAPLEEQQMNTMNNCSANNNNNSLTRCIRLGCMNSNCRNAQWDDEYCSDDCAIAHCRNVFDAWIGASSYSHNN